MFPERQNSQFVRPVPEAEAPEEAEEAEAPEEAAQVQGGCRQKYPHSSHLAHLS